jgi:flagellar assembly protein FliH
VVEETILLSNLIKSSHVISLEDLKKLELMSRISPIQQNISNSDSDNEGNDALDVETQTLKERILRWQSRRDEDAQYMDEAHRQGYEEGYKVGVTQAEEDLHRQWETQLGEAQSIVEHAYVTKETIITEGETFLVELSVSIAEKVINKKLAKAPEMAMKLFEKALSRRNEQGVIVLCVSPTQFAFVQAAKDELIRVLDSQAELQIIPDSTIKEGSCIVRSAFGSIDARVDTQLEAIREQLLRVAAHRAEEGSNNVSP